MATHQRNILYSTNPIVERLNIVTNSAHLSIFPAPKTDPSGPNIATPTAMPKYLKAKMSLANSDLKYDEV